MKRIDINELNLNEQQALVCMFFAKLTSKDPRYEKRKEYFRILSRNFGKKENTYKNSKDTYDYYFDNNGRKGWPDSDISKRGPGYKAVYDKYKDYDIAILEKAVDEIISIYSKEDRFISMKCTFPEIVHKILDGKDNIVTIDGLYTLADKLNENNIIFVTLGGDKTNREVDWDTGFYAIAHVVKSPYDYGTEGRENKYFKIDIQIDIKLPEVMDKEELIKYRDIYDAPYIGPELKRDPSQAISTLSDKQAVAVVRAIVDRYVDLKDIIENIFDKEFMGRVYAYTEMLVPVLVKYGDTLDSAIAKRIFNSEDNKIDFSKFTRSGKNILYYGVPGCGKSFYVEQYIKENISDGCVRRVVFHPDYTYTDFVGQIMPVFVADGHENKKVTYDFVYGPFAEILSIAYKYPTKSCCLVIEEINRGNAPAIFGEIFQLLDREEDKEKENFRGSKYKIFNKYLAKIINNNCNKNNSIEIPPNLSILATMNTSDQNVFSMDTAFQRRWRMKHIKNIFQGEQASIKIPDNKISWKAFAETVNEILVSRNNGFGSLEDKSLGAYFAVGEDFDSVENFAEKVIKYLWDDAFKLDRNIIFKKEFKNLNSVFAAFEDIGGLKNILLEEIYEQMVNKSKL